MMDGAFDDVKAFFDESIVLESQPPRHDHIEQSDPFVEKAEMMVAEKVGDPSLLLQRQSPVEEQEACVSVPEMESMFEDEPAGIPHQNDLGSSDVAEEAVDIAGAVFVKSQMFSIWMSNIYSVSSGNEEEEQQAHFPMRVDEIEEAVVDENSVNVPGTCISHLQPH